MRLLVSMTSWQPRQRAPSCPVYLKRHQIVCDTRAGSAIKKMSTAADTWPRDLETENRTSRGLGRTGTPSGALKRAGTKRGTSRASRKEVSRVRGIDLLADAFPGRVGRPGARLPAGQSVVSTGGSPWPVAGATWCRRMRAMTSQMRTAQPSESGLRQRPPKRSLPQGRSSRN